MEEIALPFLDESDSLVRNLVAALTSHPAFAAWLIPDQLVRTFVLVVENVADGNNPAARLTPLRPTQRFRVRGEAQQLGVDPASYARYNTHAEIVASINPVGAAELYRRLYPLITEAYAELGHPDGGFDDTLLRALRNLLEVPVLERDVTLVPRATFFEFVDDEIEDLLLDVRVRLGLRGEGRRRRSRIGVRGCRRRGCQREDASHERGTDEDASTPPSSVRHVRGRGQRSHVGGPPGRQLHTWQ